MMRRSFFSLAIACVLVILTIGQAEASGTLQFTFVYKDSSGVEQPLAQAYVYLRRTTAMTSFTAAGANANGWVTGPGGAYLAQVVVPPPMEMYFSPASYIYGPTDSNGHLSVTSVPEGEYYLRITRKAPLSDTSPPPLGPPERGDYSWSPINPVTISANTVTDLGTQVAHPFGTPLIVITGHVKDYSTGAPLVGRYVRAQTEPCSDVNVMTNTPPNYCGPVKLFALQTTDSQGKYTIDIRRPGTYYIVESRTLGDHHSEYSGNPGTTGAYIGPVTVQVGDQVTMPDMLVTPQY